MKEVRTCLAHGIHNVGLLVVPKALYALYDKEEEKNLQYKGTYSSCLFNPTKCLPMAASFVRLPCTLEHSINSFLSSELLGGCA